jgi:hypothetical protein
MCLLGVFLEVATIVKQYFAFVIETLEDSRRVCIVSGNVSFVIIGSCEVFAAHEARVQNG